MTTTVAARRSLLGSESQIAHCIGRELDLAAKLADCGLKPGYAVAVRRAVDDAGDWAHLLLERLGTVEQATRQPPSAREQGEISDPRLVLRGQMQDNMRGRRPGRA